MNITTNIADGLHNLGQMSADVFSKIVNSAPAQAVAQPIKDLGTMTSTAFRDLMSHDVHVVNDQPVITPQATPVVPVPNIAKAIGSHETQVLYDKNNLPFAPKDDAQRYSYQNPFSKALGYYQVEAPTLKTYATKYLGANITPQQFLSSPQLQDKFVNAMLDDRIKRLGLSVEEAIKAHNVGIAGLQDPKNKMKADEYLNKVLPLLKR